MKDFIKHKLRENLSNPICNIVKIIDTAIDN